MTTHAARGSPTPTRGTRAACLASRATPPAAGRGVCDVHDAAGPEELAGPRGCRLQARHPILAHERDQASRGRALRTAPSLPRDSASSSPRPGSASRGILADGRQARLHPPSPCVDPVAGMSRAAAHKSARIGCSKLQQTESACKWPLSALQQTATNCSLRRQAGTLSVRSAGAPCDPGRQCVTASLGRAFSRPLK